VVGLDQGRRTLGAAHKRVRDPRKQRNKVNIQHRVESQTSLPSQTGSSASRRPDVRLTTGREDEATARLAGITTDAFTGRGDATDGLPGGGDAAFSRCCHDDTSTDSASSCSATSLSGMEDGETSHLPRLCGRASSPMRLRVDYFCLANRYPRRAQPPLLRVRCRVVHGPQ
jgi:hypothetical protein